MQKSPGNKRLFPRLDGELELAGLPDPLGPTDELAEAAGGLCRTEQINDLGILILKEPPDDVRGSPVKLPNQVQAVEVADDRFPLDGLPGEVVLAPRAVEFVDEDVPIHFESFLSCKNGPDQLDGQGKNERLAYLESGWTSPPSFEPGSETSPSG
jgi:hypothetical protein